MLNQYIRFLRRSIYTHKYDIAQPYHKVIDLIFKLLGLGFAISGGYLIYSASSCYFSLHYIEVSPICTSIFDNILAGNGFLASREVFEVLLMRWLWGAGNLLIALFISQVLIVRHLNETLPDHIYLRCFASDEEKEKRLPSKGFEF